ncbi:response regulator [Paenibacillus sp. NEAU-GSW1]|uniref:response regulator n=1 Tax=Paenibacillus sp. NEAU-GSW1 TaxID=2682486 RepID=UPI0012E2F30E|nr:response regulator [Paenibacillus sp. NEAU-GSW1]MUT66939.1 response regulator [Paenibacillus sp. NEAU-GSW1]
MKVLLVDDEQHVRDAIRLLIDWETLGIDAILEADNGDTAIVLIEEEQPEIVITDMRMPHRDGVSLLAWLQAESRKCKTIVVSGYDDFELVRSSMKYGGLDYLLKPVDPEQLTEALRKAKLSWEGEERSRQLTQQRNMEINQIKPLYWDKLFSGLISENGGKTSLPSVLKDEFKLDLIERCLTIVVGLDTLEPAVMRKFALNRDLLFFALSNVCNEILREDGRGFAFRYWNSEHEMVLLLWGRLEEWPDTIRRVQAGIRNTIQSRIEFGIGTIQPFPSGVSVSYQKARAALKQRNLLDFSDSLNGVEPAAAASGAGGSLSMTDYEERFRVAVRSGREKDLQAAVDSWIDALSRLESISQSQMEQWFSEFDAIVNRLFNDKASRPEESGADIGEFKLNVADNSIQLLSSLMDETGRLSLSIWRERLLAGLNELAQVYHGGSNRQQEMNVMHEIAKYMEQHYHREVTLQDISERFYLSREYISRRFKQEMGENVFDYLARIRVEKARLLLANPNLKIGQIAEMVGYDDEKYFSKVFKKIEGVSPNQYRKQQEG